MKPSADACRELTLLAQRLISADGEITTAIDGLSLSRRSAPSIPCHGSYRPCLAMVLQGAKSLRLGSATIHYTTGQYLVTSLDLPVTWRVSEASTTSPHLCLSMAIDSEKVVDLVGRMNLGQRPVSTGDRWGITVNSAPADLISAATRLLRLLDTPQDIPVMAPLIEQEILYRLLSGPGGERLTTIATFDSQDNRIARAIAWLRQNYASPLRIGQLADHVNMSVSSFHHHFKAVTAMSPIQYQKQLRLTEARRLMLVEQLDAGSAGYRVGYQSPSQFSREYGRFFGQTPSRDIQAA
jgi:AraC-like DNA-binding protein